jgi:hypothetical protein
LRGRDEGIRITNPNSAGKSPKSLKYSWGGFLSAAAYMILRKRGPGLLQEKFM